MKARAEENAMINDTVIHFTTRLIARLSDKLESIAFYPHPFTGGGLIIVPNEEVSFIPDLIADIYECDPPPIMFYCLRRSELFELSSVGVFGWPNPLEEKPHLAFWLKHQGVVLHGRDIRDEIKLPANLSDFFETHRQRCKQFIRNWAIDQLRRKNYRGMIKEMERQVRYLMATALLARNEWEVSLKSIPERFNLLFRNELANQAWANVAALARQADEIDESASRQFAFEALWFFEQFLLTTGEYTR